MDLTVNQNLASVQQAADPFMGFSGGFASLDAPRVGTTVPTSSPDMTGIDSLLRAAASIESLVSQASGHHSPTIPRIRSVKAISIESLCSPSPGPRPPSTSRMPDLSLHAKSSFARRAAQLESPLPVPEEDESVDVDMHNNAWNPGSIPMSPPYVIKNKPGLVAGGRVYSATGADFATRMMARADTDKGSKQMNDYLGQNKEHRKGFQCPDTPAPLMDYPRADPVAIDPDFEILRERQLNSKGRISRESGYRNRNRNGADSELEILAVKKVKKANTSHRLETQITHTSNSQSIIRTALETGGHRLKTSEPRPRPENSSGRVQAPSPRARA